MDVTVIIVNYKTPDYIINTIKSIKQMSEGFSYEIIVVDNASGDGSVEKIRKECPDILIIPSEQNLGTSKAYNNAMNKAKGEYVFLLNPDTKLLNNAIFEMLMYLRKHEDVAIVCGNLFDLDGNPTHSYHEEIFDLAYIKQSSSLFNMLLAKMKKKKWDKEFNYTNHPIEIGYACAAAMLMRKEDIDKVGGFDESIFMYGEEAALSFKLKKLGLKTISIPSPRIMHFEGGSFKDKDKATSKFSQNRYERFIKGNYATMEIIEGNGGGKKYYQELLSNEKKKLLPFRLLGKKDKTKITNKKIEIINRCLEELDSE